MSEISNENQNIERCGLYLSLKTRTKYTSGIFDYSSDETNNLNTFIIKESKKTIFITRTPNDNIKVYSQQGEISKEDQLLFTITIRKNSFQIGRDLKYIFPFKKINETNIKYLNNFLWFVINSDTKENNNPNEDYYLSVGDIIKMGKVKYIVKEIVIKGKKEENKNGKNIKMLDLIPECLESKKCEYCNETIFHLCECEEFVHFNCIKDWIDERIMFKKNNKNTVRNYYINIYYCEEFLSIKKQCAELEHRHCECIKCNTYYPLKFKYKNKDNDEKEKKEITKEEIKDFYPIEIKTKSDYMILESLEYCDTTMNSSKVIKAIHIIDLTEEGDINIGSATDNDVIVNESSVSRYHSVIKYKDGKLLLKNKSEKAGTLVLIHNSNISIKQDKSIYLQIDKTFIEAQIIKEKEFFDKKKNNETRYPILDNNAEKKENESSINQQITNIEEPSYAAKLYGD